LIPIAKPFIGAREQLAVARVLRSGNLAQGPEVAKFEEEFSVRIVEGIPVVAVNSGTSGLHLAMVARGVTQGDEIIVPSFTFAATPNSVVLAGARPIFCDIDPFSFTLDVDKLSDVLSPKTKGIMPVHLFGHPADMERLAKFASAKGLFVIEDAAQAHGAKVGTQNVGTFGDMSIFSNYPTKNMTSGEGGMVACRNREEASRLKLLRNQGMEVRYQNEIVGYNNRMTDIHAAIGRVQLTRLEKWNKKRRSNARYLSDQIENVITPTESEGFTHVYHQYTIRVPEDRDGFAKALLERFKVGCGVYYPTPTHKLPSLRNFSPIGDLPETDKAAAEVLSLPVHPGLSQRDLDTIVKSVNILSRAGS